MDVEYYQNDPFRIYHPTSNGKVLGPKIKNEDIYFEFTHYNGSNYHLIGFKVGNTPIYLYPQGASIYYFWKAFDTYEMKYSMENTIPTSETTVGIGYSTLERKIYAFYQNNFSTLFLSEAKENDEIIPHFFQGAKDDTEDYISLNFGQKPFIYNIPGFRSYCYAATHIKICSICLCRPNYYFCYSYFVFILI